MCNEKFDVVKFLIESGANLKGCLAFAADKGFVEIVEKIIEKGIDQNEMGRAFLIACYMGNFKMLKLLEKYGANIFVKSNRDVGFYGPWGETGLHLACEGYSRDVDGCHYDGKSVIVKYLIEKGLNVNERDSDGMTPIMYAVKCAYTPIVAILIENGADVNVKNNNGLNVLKIAKVPNPLDQSVEARNLNMIRVIKLLKQAGARE